MSVEEIFQTMQELVAEQFAMEPSEVTMETSFEEDLGADSVDLVELVMAMEEEFEMGEVLLQRRNNSVRLTQQGRPVCLPLFVDDEQQLPQAGSAAPAAFREVRPREKGLLLRRHKNAGGPAAAAGKCLADGHIDAVNIRPFLPVHLDGHKITVQDLRDLRILKALMGHHMAPVAGTVSDAQENRLVLFPCPPERRLAPGIPVHRIFGVLEQIGTGLML